MKDLGKKAVEGALARICAQLANLALRLGSLAVLARLLDPKDFGLVGMVTALTGVLNLFKDFGLSAASVQRANVTDEEKSTLFWINILVGCVLAVTTLGISPEVARFYREPRLYWVANIIAFSFLFNAAGIQHFALLQRQLRFTTLSIIDTSSWIVSTALAIAAARSGYGYWALVAMTVCQPLVSTTLSWLVSGWVPGSPWKGTGVGSLMRFGGALTVNGLIVYIASNFEKVLLGRFWGADAIGIYGRGYQLIRIPTDTLNGAVGEVAFSALSRLQQEPERLRRYFLRGYSLVLALTLPATFACCVLATDLIGVLLGPKWREAATIFRLLTPTIVVLAIANPLSWLLGAIGMVGRGVKMSLVIAPLMIASYLVGVPYGPKGVAVAYSTIMVLWLIPVVAWSVYGTVLSLKDIWRTVRAPLASSSIAGAITFGVGQFHGQSHLMRLILGGIILSGTYVGLLLFGFGQKSYYLDLLQRFVKRSAAQDEIVAAA
jgi:PST family polysaccharide transporter